MCVDSPEGPNWSYDPSEYSFCDLEQSVRFVRASDLYDAETGDRRCPDQGCLGCLWADGLMGCTIDEATDAEVREALADLEGDR